ncbi:cytochrome c maturation protein CcmE [Salinadaptatus halalkaliphilus]|uniref:Cytochrome c maturation protein CcmE n=1 Tax=Salinadaptatus halalkaliphilus TaxID=2419781 RepID=A0A4S3TKU2_9EURY|nr:cytochrome c maturation protein CcmE [Salinadaptatus halalkaliphilus]THE64731.1 cytochrome c maturation protein CcmE [Salinadaptatus halalkaliphilus]
MDRKTKVVVGGIGIVVLLAILATTTMGSAAEFVTPTDLVETDDHEDDLVKLEGRVVDLEDGDDLEFDVVDENHTVAVSYDGERPETMSEGRLVVAEGHYDGDQLTADDLTVRAHEGEHPDDANESSYDHPDYDGDDYEGGSTTDEYADGGPSASPQ